MNSYADPMVDRTPLVTGHAAAVHASTIEDRLQNVAANLEGMCNLVFELLQDTAGMLDVPMEAPPSATAADGRGVRFMLGRVEDVTRGLETLLRQHVNQHGQLREIVGPRL